MSSSVNKVILIGRVGKDPEIRSFNDGKRIAQFSLATSERWKDRATGEQKEKTEWHNIVVKNDVLVDLCEKYVNKGSSIYLEGALATRKWQTNDGSDRYSTEVVLGPFKSQLTLLESKADREGREGGERREPARTADKPKSGGATYATKDTWTGGRGNDGLDDEIPF